MATSLFFLNTHHNPTFQSNSEKVKYIQSYQYHIFRSKPQSNIKSKSKKVDNTRYQNFKPKSQSNIVLLKSTFTKIDSTQPYQYHTFQSKPQSNVTSLKSTSKKVNSTQSYRYHTFQSNQLNSENIECTQPYLYRSKSIKFHSFPIFSQKSSNLSNPNSSIDYTTTQNPSKFNLFLTNEELKKLKFLENYTYKHKLPSGYLTIRAMKDNELEKTVEILAESFAESMFLPAMYLTLLGYLIKQYLSDRRGLMPYCVTLIGLLSDEICDENDGILCGTVEVSFDRRGANAKTPTPTPPKNCPYVCNMAVRETLRRRGIGGHLLKASEELISIMGSSRNVYLHCRLIDAAPFNMYKKAGYDVVKTDSFLVLLTLQRRKHLMFKELPALSEPLETVISLDEIESPSMDARESGSAPLDEVLRSSLDMDG